MALDDIAYMESCTEVIPHEVLQTVVQIGTELFQETLHSNQVCMMEENLVYRNFTLKKHKLRIQSSIE